MPEPSEHARYAHTITKSAIGTPLTLLEIPCLDFAGEDYVGTILVHPAMARATQAFFAALKAQRFPIFAMQAGPWPPQVLPSRQFRLSNTIGFVDKRRFGGTTPSHHAVGLAFDVNPLLNPLVDEARGLRVPPFAVYHSTAPGTVTEEFAALAESLGFLWGGHWREKQDYMHFSWADCASILPDLEPERPGAVFA